MTNRGFVPDKEQAGQRPRVFFSSYDDRKNPYYGGGGARAIHEVARRLTRNFDITVVTGKYPGAKDEEIDGVKYERIGSARLGPRLGQLAFSLSLPLAVRRRQFDLWVESFTPPFSAGLVPLFTPKPVVGLAHMLSAEDMARKHRLPFGLVERLGLKAYKNFIAVQDNLAKKIRAVTGSAKVSVITNGTGLPDESGREEKKEFITFLGRVEVGQKGLDLLLEAYRDMGADAQYRLLIAGSGTAQEERRLKALISELGLDGQVLLAGRVEERQKAEIFRKTALLVAPSRFETFGMAVLEGMAYGLPVVVTDIEGFKWIPKEAVIKARAEDAQSLAKSMREALFDPKLRSALSAAAVRVAKAHSWEKAAEKYEELFASVLEGAAGGLPSSAAGSPKENPIIRKIVKKKLPCYFISPHLDDAILSAGDLMSFLSGKTDLTVITVFTKSAPGRGTLSVRHFLKLHGYADAEKMYEDRRAEDERVCGQLGAKAVHLGFTDALWRREPAMSPLSKLLGGMVPELEFIYPTYRFHVVSGKPKKEDHGLKQEIAAALRRLVPAGKDSAIFCPAGFGGHVDHVLVREVCRELFGNTVFWKDFPYKAKARDGESVRDRRTFEWQDNPEKKQALVSGYESQVKKMFPEGRVPKTVETYFAP